MLNFFIEECCKTFFKLRWKLFFLFGTLAAFGAAASGWLSFGETSEHLNLSMKSSLSEVGDYLSSTMDGSRLEEIHSSDHPAYQEFKRTLQDLTGKFHLSWIGVYRFNGRYFTAIVDGADAGSEFCPGYPIFDSSDELVQAWEGTPTVSKVTEDAYGAWISAYYPVRNASGTVVAVIDASRDADLLGQIRTRVVNNTLKNVGLIVLLTLVVSMLFSSTLTRSLGLLAEGARQVSVGDLSVNVPVQNHHDEIGHLTEMFNGMTGELKRSKDELDRKIFELTLLFDISQRINYANSTDEILRMILEKFIKAMKAQRGSILMYNEDENVLAVAVACGEGFEKTIQRVRLAPGEGVAGKVFQEQTPLILNNISEEMFKPYDDPVEFDVKSIMCIPLILEKKPIGVINLVNKRSGDFSQADHTLGMTLASQIALTIEKSRLYELAVTDGLTKLFVHRYFQIALDGELKRAKRYKNPASLILMDIDHFKKFNDTWGHQTGDMVLVHTARLLKESLRSPDIAARYGGEELAVILPETDAARAMLVAERIRKAIEDFDFPGTTQALKVTVSVGVSSFPQHAETKLNLIRCADEAMYSCKKAGRNCARLFEPGQSTDLETTSPEDH